MKKSKRFFMSLLYLLFILFLVEGVTRLFFKMTDKDIDVYRNFSFERLPKIFASDPVLGCKLIPNVSRNAFTSDFRVIYKTNSIGLREKEITDTDKFKIVFLGDSLTFGEGISYGMRFSDLIEKDIENVYTINAGVPGYGIHQMFAWFRHYGVHLQPDLVICSITPTIMNRAMYEEIESSPHLIISQQNEEHYENATTHDKDSFKNIFAEFLQRSYFYCVAKVRVQIMQKVFFLKERDRQVWKEVWEEGDGGHRITADGRVRLLEKISRNIFLELKNTCDRMQAELLIVNISLDSLPWLSNFLTEHNIDYLDISDKLRKIPKIRFEIDPHYNAKGNRAIADLIREYILNRYQDEIANRQNKNKF